jgi:hypothetical protein
VVRKKRAEDRTSKHPRTVNAWITIDDELSRSPAYAHSCVKATHWVTALLVFLNLRVTGTTYSPRNGVITSKALSA